MKRFLVLGALLAGMAFAQDLTITNARVITGTGQVINQGSVVIRAGRIAAVSAGAPANAAGRTIDAKGMTVMAGFIDAHRHIINGNEEKWFKEDAAKRMQEFLETGYTTLMSGGGPVPGIVELKKKIESGELKGPRIITSGRADPANFKTPEAAREQVRKLKAAGVEIIKAAINPDPAPWELEVLTAVADESKKNGLDLMVHAVTVPSMLAAIRAGATKLVHTPHGSFMTDIDAVAVRQAGVEVLSCAGFGVPVFGVYNKENKPTFRDGKPWPNSILNSEGRGREAGEKTVNARTLWDNGVTYGFGTDTVYDPHEGLKHELRSLNLMFSPEDLIKIMGPNTAAFHETMKDGGTLEVGKWGDVVVLDGNPLEGYWGFLNAKIVVKGGVVMVEKK